MARVGKKRRAANKAVPEPTPRRLARFFAKTEPDDACWRWTAYTDDNGYGVVVVNWTRLLAHRVSYTWLVGPIPDGLELDHTCRHPWCVNPFHLEAVVHEVNVRRGRAGWNLRARTHCPRDHAYDEANTYRTRDGRRQCRTCSRDRQRAAAAAKRAANG